ncbi:hypothetical protein GHT06_012377 [Daphnia sinensis]|uniref:Uncharacterized protein n=1 Tax=Daphnia sinensis TaxID=1820382 RepID=A0AAD5PZR2_9CRUS|nr:hypothetical protein GHT06_012377 [Daphnia sinensis]
MKHKEAGEPNPCKGRTGKHLLLRAARPVIYIVRGLTHCACAVCVCCSPARTPASILHRYTCTISYNLIPYIYQMPVALNRPRKHEGPPTFILISKSIPVRFSYGSERVRVL